MKKVITALIILCLVGCSPIKIRTPKEMSEADYSAFPENYQQIITDYNKYILKDPDSAIYEFFKPQKGVNKGTGKFGWVTCYSVNAKNSYGAYIGYRYECALIKNGRVEIRGINKINYQFADPVLNQ